MSIFDFFRPGKNDSEIMLKAFKELNKQMSVALVELEKYDIEIDYPLYFSFLCIYVSHIYLYSMLAILDKTYEYANENIGIFLEKVIDKYAMNPSGSSDLETIYISSEVCKKIADTMNEFGDEFDDLFGNHTIDNSIIGPISHKFLFNLCEVEGLDHIKDYTETTLYNITYKYVNAWS